MARLLIKPVKFRLTVYAPYDYLENSSSSISTPNHVVLKAALAEFASVNENQLIYGGASDVSGSVGSQSGNYASFSSPSILTPLYNLVPVESNEKLVTRTRMGSNDFYVRAVGAGSKPADRVLSAAAAVAKMTAPYAAALALKPLPNAGSMYPNTGNGNHFLIPPAHYAGTEIDVPGIEYRAQLPDEERPRLVDLINNKFVPKLQKKVKVSLGAYSPGETTTRAIRVDGQAATVEEEIVLFLILDTSNSRFTYELSPVNVDSVGGRAIEFKNSMNDNLYRLSLLWQDCVLTEAHIADARITMPDFEGSIYAPDLKMDHDRYNEVLDEFQTNLPTQCDPAKHEDAAAAAEQTLDDYLATLTAKHLAADTTTDPSWLDKAMSAIGGAGSAIGGYLSKWSPIEYVGAAAAGLAVKEASDKKWLLPLAIAAGAILILK